MKTQTLPVPKKKLKTEKENHIVLMFDQINDWFFGNDTTDFDPTVLEYLEEKWLSTGKLSTQEYKDLVEIYKNNVCN